MGAVSNIFWVGIFLSYFFTFGTQMATEQSTATTMSTSWPSSSTQETRATPVKQPTTKSSRKPSNNGSASVDKGINNTQVDGAERRKEKNTNVSLPAWAIATTVVACVAFLVITIASIVIGKHQRRNKTRRETGIVQSSQEAEDLKNASAAKELQEENNHNDNMAFESEASNVACARDPGTSEHVYEKLDETTPPSTAAENIYDTATG
ncbi:hypothetical protein ACROYT_G036486 [Oculina patagonica]